MNFMKLAVLIFALPTLSYACNFEEVRGKDIYCTTHAGSAESFTDRGYRLTVTYRDSIATVNIRRHYRPWSMSYVADGEVRTAKGKTRSVTCSGNVLTAKYIKQGSIGNGTIKITSLGGHKYSVKVTNVQKPFSSTVLDTLSASCKPL